MNPVQQVMLADASSPAVAGARIVSLSEFLSRHKNFVEALETMTPSTRSVAFEQLQQELSGFVGTVASFAMAHRLLEVAGEICSQMSLEELLVRTGCDRRLPLRGASRSTRG